ncbi:MULTISPECIES: hypothetical protein [unclassified Roseateles]|nr:hypothetical protein [Paucibacter sp. KCTC 42545]MBY0236253.1 hypothetical protein [Burkholderiaceae bacterium]
MSFVLLALTALAFASSCGLAILSWYAAEQVQAEMGRQALGGLRIWDD